MNENTFQPAQPDDAFDRMRGADPAAGVEPDQISLDAAVRARLADPGDELAAVRARRGRSRWMAVAAVAAGALAFSTAGYAVGNRTGGTPTAAGAAITLGQPATGPQDAGAELFGEQSSGGIRPEADSGVKAPVPMASSGASDRMSSAMIAPWYGGRTVFTSSGLSDAAGSAQAWAYDPARVFSADTANRLAKVLGVAGTAALVDDVWTVGPVDGSGRQLQLQPDGLTSVNYYDPALDPYGCPSPPVPEDTEPGVDLQRSDATSSDGSGSSGSTGSGSAEPSGAVDRPVPGPACTTKPAGAAPQGAAAVAKAKELMRSLGLDADAFEYEVQDSGMKQSSYVSAYQVVGGERSGSTWSIGLVGDGVQSLYGSLAPVSSLGSYYIVSPKDAVARLTDPRFGPSYSGWPMPYAAAEKSVMTEDTPTTAEQGVAGATPDIAQVPSRTVPPTVKAGSAIVWPVTEVTLTKSRLGLTMYTLPDGATLLLPAYELSGGGDGQTWSVVAVTDAQLDFTAVK